MKQAPENDFLRIQQFGPALQGVFRLSDLQIALKGGNLSTLHNRINRLVRNGLLNRFKNGFYTTPDFSRETLSVRIDPTAYFSLGTVLAANGLVSTVPNRNVVAVKIGRNRCYQIDSLTIEHLGISDKLYFGFTLINGARYADSEKAWIDTLYYHMRGRKYSFNPETDVDLSRLNRSRVTRYLACYKNKRFVKFCRSLLDGR